MTVVLVLFTLIAFLTADRFVQRYREKRALQPAIRAAGIPVLSSIPLPDGTAVALNHTWYRIGPNGVCTVGLDEFVGRLAGAVESIFLPGSGLAVSQDRPGITLRDGNRKLEFSTPVSGHVMKVNHSVLRHPGLLNRDPYGDGWLLKIRAEQGNDNASSGKQGRDAVEWLKDQVDRAKQFLVERSSQPELALMMDGGALADGVLKSFDGDVWQDFQRTFVASTQKPEQKDVRP